MTTEHQHSSKGDPEGRRIAARRASLLGEASRVGRLMELLLKRADFDPAPLTDVLKAVTRKEVTELQKANGRLESRQRHKGQASHPLLDDRTLDLLYVDEGGKSHTEPNVPGPTYFSLAAVAMNQEASDEYCAAADTIKIEFFGRTDFAFHEPFMRERYGDSRSGIDYSFADNPDRQLQFDEAIGKLIDSTDFITFGVAIDKHAYEEEFTEKGLDPYLPTDVYALATVFLLERYVDALAYLGPKKMGRITFESQGPKEDAYHQLEYARILLEGSQWLPEASFRNWLYTGLAFAPKVGSHPCELADFLARDLYEWIKNGCTNKPKWWHHFCSKVYVRGDGLMGKFGIKVFPDTEIREVILAHRRMYGAV